MTARGPVQWQTQARELHTQGWSRNKIADELGVSRTTVTRWAQREGLDFDRAQTAAAVAAQRLDLEKARLDLLSGLIIVASQEIERASKPYVVFSFGGQYNEYAEHTLDLPPAEAVRQMTTSAAVVLDKVHRELDRRGDGSLQTVGALVDKVIDQLGIRD